VRLDGRLYVSLAVMWSATVYSSVFQQWLLPLLHNTVPTVGTKDCWHNSYSQSALAYHHRKNKRGYAHKMFFIILECEEHLTKEGHQKCNEVVILRIFCHIDCMYYVLRLFSHFRLYQNCLQCALFSVWETSKYDGNLNIRRSVRCLLWSSKS
jgi:hypothetical protein